MNDVNAAVNAATDGKSTRILAVAERPRAASCHRIVC